MDYGFFDDATRSFVVTSPVPPRPWINYLGNRRLKAFISQNAGGLVWQHEPYTRRISRYHYVAPPGDRPGFYLYVKDRRTGTLWNPHFAPSCTKLDAFECRHAPGQTRFLAEKDGLVLTITYAIPPDDEVMLWDVTVRNQGEKSADLLLCSYLEFGLLEFMREALGWCYLKNQFAVTYVPELRAIRYDYHVFEAPATPRMLFACSAPVHSFDCSRDAFIGRTGTLAAPEALADLRGLRNSELPLGGHACATLGVDAQLAPGESMDFAWVLAVADNWAKAEELVGCYGNAPVRQTALKAVETRIGNCLNRLQVDTGDVAADRMINTWNPANCLVTLENARMISTDHMGIDGLRYRDTTQDALAVAHLDPDFAMEQMRGVLACQRRDGSGCFAFYPHTDRAISDEPKRSDNTVWPVYTFKALLAETGDWRLLDEVVAWRDGGEASVYTHLMEGLRYIAGRCGPHGLPLLDHADWNDGLALFGDQQAESVMLGLQLVFACREMREICERSGQERDANWCAGLATELDAVLNSSDVWDGRWYRRLLLSNGKYLGGAECRQGSLYLNPQSWSVLSGTGARDGRGQVAMDCAAELLDTEAGLRILAPPFTGIPEPEDPPLGSNPGIGENGGIFCHANTWAIIAECLLGNGDRAFKYYRQLLPESLIARFGAAHYQREPYVYVSSIIGPVSERFGEGGISWLTGTASWMYVAATQYLLGIRPTLDGLVVTPCLPACLTEVQAVRRFRGCAYHISLNHRGCETPQIRVNGEVRSGPLPIVSGGELRVQVDC